MNRNSLIILIAATVMVGCATMNSTPDPAVGSWKFELINPPRGDPEGTLIISKDGGVYSGSIVNSTGEYELNELLVEGNQLVSGHFAYRNSTIQIKGVFEGSAFQGNVSGGRNSVEMVGERVE
jgi:hypothetical protein